MEDEIKEILGNIKSKYEDYYVQDIVSGNDLKLLLDYITNLQKENEKLKEKLHCKEYFSSTMPENTEFVILTKENYERQQKDIELELIDYKLRCEKAIEYNIGIIKDTKGFYRPTEDIIYSGDTLIDIAEQNINILQGSDNNE